VLLCGGGPQKKESCRRNIVTSLRKSVPRDTPYRESAPYVKRFPGQRRTDGSDHSIKADARVTCIGSILHVLWIFIGCDSLVDKLRIAIFHHNNSDRDKILVVAPLCRLCVSRVEP
jgi:hypothetical protein